MIVPSIKISSKSTLNDLKEEIKLIGLTSKIKFYISRNPSRHEIDLLYRFYDKCEGIHIGFGLIDNPPDECDTALRAFSDFRNINSIHLQYATNLTNLGVLLLYPNLESLRIGEVGGRHYRLNPISVLQNLKKLSILGKDNDCEFIKELLSLEDIIFEKCHIISLEFIESQNIKTLNFSRCRADNWSLISGFQGKELSMTLINGLTTVSFLENMQCLEKLLLSRLAHVSSLPNMIHMKCLKAVTLNKMSSLRDISPLLTAPSLEELFITEGQHLDPSDFLPFVKLKKLQKAGVYLGNTRKNEIVSRMFANKYIK